MNLAAGHGFRVARLTVEQVEAMIEASILRDGEPIELLDGVLVCKDRSARGEDPRTIGVGHNVVVTLIAQLGAELAARGSQMQTQGPLRIPPYDYPEPDGLVLRGEVRAYADRLPGPADATAVIEVADSSLESDRGKKLELYARAGIAQYIIVNLRDACVEVYERPNVETAAYVERAVLRAGELLKLRTAAQLPLEIDVARILP